MLSENRTLEEKPPENRRGGVEPPENTKVEEKTCGKTYFRKETFVPIDNITNILWFLIKRSTS